MISCDFQYYRPRTLGEAGQIFRELEQMGGQPVYYAGGTEIITLARGNRLQPGAVIDIKAVPECRELAAEGEVWIYGAAVTLTESAEGHAFPLLRATIRHLADRTTRNKATLGGNVCGRLPYREALLPFLLTDAQAVVAGEAGLRTLRVESEFAEGQTPARGELLVQLRVDRRYAQGAFFHRKRMRMGGVDYPLVTVAALRVEDRLRVAVSGVTAFPFRAERMEERLNDTGLTIPDRVEAAVRELPAPVLNDMFGSDGYRLQLLRLSLRELLEKLG